MITLPALRCLLDTVLEAGWPLVVEMVDVSAAMLYRVSSADLKFEGHPPKSFPWPCRMASAHVVAGVRESVMQLVASGSRAELLSERPMGVGRHYGPLVRHAGSPIQLELAAWRSARVTIAPSLCTAPQGSDLRSVTP